MDENQMQPVARGPVVRSVNRSAGPQDRTEVQMSDGGNGDGQDGQGH